MEKRSAFSSKLGFVLAAAGSAVGLGNIWRFPYLVAKYGGGMFILLYILLVVTFGFTLMIAEVAIGRKTGLSPICAFEKLNKKYSFIGILASLVAVVILPYYSVIGGWVMKYIAAYFTSPSIDMAKDNYFTAFIGKTAEPIIWQLLFIVACAVIVFLGVKNGIEKANKFLMPILIALSIFIAIYSITLPGAIEGVKYLFLPDIKNFSITTLFAALGQMFYSMSLAMGIMITYGSYIKKEQDLEKSVKQIEIFDTSVAILASMMVIPAVFAFSGGDISALNKGPGLMFITLPKVFDGMNFGAVIGILFFILVLFAALTSAISLMEAIVASLQDKFKLGRNLSVGLVATLVFVLGIPSSLGFGMWDFVKVAGLSILDMMDTISNGLLMPLVALLTCLFIGYVIKVDTIVDEVKISSKFKREKMFVVIIKYVAPIFIVTILITTLLDNLGIIKM